MFRSTSFAAIGLIAGTGTLFAADAVATVSQAPSASYAPSFSWDGFHAGVHGGFGWADGRFSAGGTSQTFDFDGARFGGFAGYNWTLSPSIVAGIEADLNYDGNEETYGGDTASTAIAGGVRGRVGYSLDRTLIYAAGGWTATRFEINGGSDAEKTLHGWTIGAGVDHAFTDRVFGRLEYRYNDYGKADVAGVDVDFDQHVINAGIGVRF